LSNIIEIENFLLPSECDNLIEVHNELFDKYGKLHNQTQVLTLMSTLLNSDKKSNKLKHLHAKISAHIQDIDKHSFVNYFEVVKWKEGLNMDGHYDFDYHKWTSVIYLNDNYEGGETFVDDKIIIPLKGKIVTFTGSVLLHGVNKILKGNRYTTPVWYMSTDAV